MKIKGFKLSIKLRIALLYAIIFSFILIVLNASVLYGLKYYLVYQAFDDIQNQSDVIVEKLKEVDGIITSVDKDLLFGSLIGENMYLKIVDLQGKIVYVSSPHLIDISYDKNINTPTKIEKDETHIAYINREYIYGNKGFYIQVYEDLKNQYFFLKLLFVMMAVSDVIGVLVSFFAGYFITGRALRPVDYMVREVHAIDEKKLNKRLSVNGNNDELSKLAATFNDMLDRLEDYFKRQNAFISNVSHELRTPLSVLKGYIELIDRWGKDNKDVLEESIGALKKEEQEMEILIERLLMLARGDNKTLNVNKKLFNVYELIAEIVRDAKVIFNEKNIEIFCDKTLEVNADRNLIKELLRIILDNALKYTDIDGNIKIFAEEVDKNVAVIIKDDGIGIPEEEIPYIFDRFYRVDKARSKETGGMGLGLSIAKLIVELHGGSIEVRSKLNEGSEFKITIPKV
ncbi:MULTISPECIES: sensor histidine kinase [Thermoanaerobacterium]|uniref:Signal transduction histidine-protein kinase ArlS n=2 Tax=Thermoanaerobacterium TaxID=28895 RepID=W9E925_9THEO|nr:MULTISPECIES: ATP-binding protein [Thermoanaerobacterium]AFK86628.1 integral membrane sensor signal transduction histidine kinase [Thermoanaerobacterium saccharolyticum JW/SL-YS485]ETO38357.1 integral membrane sensor signal transduction histidine kinase [Thermoanaerobacterium aotearoense SCUT27]